MVKMNQNIRWTDEREVLRLDEQQIKDAIVPLLRFPVLEETGVVEHCFTTRLGGVSEGIYTSMNLSFTRGDKEEAVQENYGRIAQCMGASKDAFVCSDQTHTTNVRVVTKEDAGAGVVRERGYTDVDGLITNGKKATKEDAGCGVTRPKTYQDVDGLITNVPGLVLSTFFADCVPLYFVDPVHRAIGMSHSGWRGTVGRMGRATILAMGQEYGTKPEDLICAIGPSICKDCYEVSEDVAEAFAAEFKGQEEKILEAKGNGKYQLDLWKANEIVLLEAGVKKSHLAVTNLCTCCNPELLFSHRASHGKRGNLGAFLRLKEENE